ncbi:MAG TPA: phytanoyl-CoA dioxygenase family protein, partial [Blastocatellia bacterium]|nr:phytanoyl-CoA dioxygenase family protein [Blastocatellia bacterium]
MKTAEIIQPSVNSIEDALDRCGATETTLAPSEKEALDRDGYVVLPEIIDTDWLERLRSAFEKACGKDGKSAAIKESGTRHVDDLVNIDSTFDGIYTHPRVLAAVYHVLRCSFRVGQMTGREPLPGYGAQGLHADWTVRTRGEPFRIVTTIWLLDDFNSENGATRVVPGTHHLLTQPPKSLADPASRHPDQKIITARAGSVLVFNGHLWHSGTRNETDRRRRVVQCSFVGRDELRFGKTKVITPERLSAEARYLFGV